MTHPAITQFISDPAVTRWIAARAAPIPFPARATYSRKGECNVET